MRSQREVTFIDHSNHWEGFPRVRDCFGTGLDTSESC